MTSFWRNGNSNKHWCSKAQLHFGTNYSNHCKCLTLILILFHWRFPGLLTRRQTLEASGSFKHKAGTPVRLQNRISKKILKTAKSLSIFRSGRTTKQMFSEPRANHLWWRWKKKSWNSPTLNWTSLFLMTLKMGDRPTCFSGFYATEPPVWYKTELLKFSMSIRLYWMYCVDWIHRQ